MQKVKDVCQRFDDGARLAQILHQPETIGINWLGTQFLI